MTSSEIRREIQLEFPGIRHVWLTDTEYQAPTIEQITERVESSWPDESYLENVSECEDLSLFLHADIKRGDVDQEFNTAFGECIEKTPFGGVHTLCLCVCADGVYLIDPTIKKIFKPENNNVFFVKM